MLQARPEEELDDLSGLYEANIASPSRQQLRRHCHSRLVVYFRWQLFCSYLRVVNSGNGRRCVVRFGHHRRCSGKDRRCTGTPAPRPAVGSGLRRRGGLCPRSWMPTVFRCHRISGAAAQANRTGRGGCLGHTAPDGTEIQCSGD